MDEIAERMRSVEWSYADNDPLSLSALRDRIASVGRDLKLITYSTLVSDLEFRLPNIQHGAPYRIRVDDWSGLDRAIVGEFLGRISTDTYIEAGFMASCGGRSKSAARGGAA